MIVATWFWFDIFVSLFFIVGFILLAHDFYVHKTKKRWSFFFYFRKNVNRIQPSTIWYIWIFCLYHLSFSFWFSGLFHLNRKKKMKKKEINKRMPQRERKRDKWTTKPNNIYMLFNVSMFPFSVFGWIQYVTIRYDMIRYPFKYKESLIFYNFVKILILIAVSISFLFVRWIFYIKCNALCFWWKNLLVKQKIICALLDININMCMQNM